MDPFPSLPTRSPLPLWSLLGTAMLAFLIPVLLHPTPTQAQASQTVPSTEIEFLTYGSKATAVAISGNGTHIAIGARDVPSDGSRAVLWNLGTQTRVRTTTYSSNQAPHVAFDSAGSRFAVASGKDDLTVWPLDSSRTAPVQSPDGPIHDLAFGPQGTLGVGGGRSRGHLHVWPNGPFRTPTIQETNSPPQSITFSPTTPELLASHGTHVTLWNYRFNTLERINVTDRCPGRVRQVEMPSRPTFFYVITERDAECNPDYLCTIRLDDQTVIDQFRRKNVSNIEHIRGNRVAFSRGRYVYTLNLQSRKERIVFASKNKVHDLSYAAGHLVVANSDVVVLDL